mgnify:CR=1 FL=1
MHYKNILVQNSDQICYLTVNRPKYLNSLNNETINELSFCIKEIIQNKEIKCVILTGAEKKAFVAGADIKEFSDFNKIQAKDLSKNGHEKLFNLIENSSIPFIAAVNGICAGGGYEVALACDEILLVDDRSSTVSLPEVPLLGVLPGTGGVTRLIDKRKVRKDIADIFCTNADGVRGKKALEWNLVDYIAPPSKFSDLINERVTESSKTVKYRNGTKGIKLNSLKRKISKDIMVVTGRADISVILNSSIVIL